MDDQKTVMLVEDEAIIALSETRVLKHAGYDVIHVLTGEDAVRRFREDSQRIDLVLMDIDLGRGMDGTEAATRILAMREVPLVFLSSHTEKHYTDRTDRITSYGYIVKNSGETVLLASIKMAFRLYEANSALRTSEEQFRSIVEKAPQPIFISTDGHFSYLNPAALELFGAQSPDEIVGRSVKERIHPDYRASEDQPVYTTGSSEQKWVRLDGSELWVETVAEPYRHEGVPGILVLMRDNTEQKRHAEELEWWHRLMRYVVWHDPTAVALLDDQLHFLYVSRRFLEDYRVSKEDVLGKHHYDAFPDIPERWREVHRRALAGEVLSNQDDWFRRSDGSIDHTRWECRPWYREDGTVGGIILYTEVITTLRMAQERFRGSTPAQRTEQNTEDQ